MSVSGELRWSAVAALRRQGVMIQDLLGVLFDLRPLCRFPLARVRPGAGEALDRFLAESGLRSHRYGSRWEQPGVTMLCIGREPERFGAFEEAAAAKAESRSAASSRAATRRMGELLGYPRCCIDAFAATETEDGPSGPVCFPREVLRRSKPGPHPFVMNFLHCLHSRSSGAGELERMLGGGYRGMELYALPWIPCRFDCRPSVRFGRGFLREAGRLNAAFAAELRRGLETTVLFLDDWSFVALEGARRHAGGWRYRAVLDMKTLMPAGDVELLRNGGELRAGKEGRLSVYREGRRTGRLSRTATVFEFKG